MLNEMHLQEIKYLLYWVIHTRIIPTVVTPQKLCRKNFISKYCQLSSNTAHNVAVRSSQHMLYYLTKSLCSASSLSCQQETFAAERHAAAPVPTAVVSPAHTALSRKPAAHCCCQLIRFTDGQTGGHSTVS